MFILSYFDFSRHRFVLRSWSLQFFLWLALVFNGETDFARIIAGEPWRLIDSTRRAEDERVLSLTCNDTELLA